VGDCAVTVAWGFAAAGCDAVLAQLQEGVTGVRIVLFSMLLICLSLRSCSKPRWNTPARKTTDRIGDANFLVETQRTHYESLKKTRISQSRKKSDPRAIPAPADRSPVQAGQNLDS